MKIIRCYISHKIIAYQRLMQNQLLVLILFGLLLIISAFFTLLIFPKWMALIESLGLALMANVFICSSLVVSIVTIFISPKIPNLKPFSRLAIRPIRFWIIIVLDRLTRVFNLVFMIQLILFTWICMLLGFFKLEIFVHIIMLLTLLYVLGLIILNMRLLELSIYWKLLLSLSLSVLIGLTVYSGFNIYTYLFSSHLVLFWAFSVLFAIIFLTTIYVVKKLKYSL